MSNLALASEESLAHLNEAVSEIEKDFQFHRNVFEIARMGPWEQYAENDVLLTESWFTFFGRRNQLCMLMEYCQWIDDPVDRDRVFEARRNLISQPPGTRWTDTFSLNGRKVRSKACVVDGDTLVGFDMLVE